MTSRLLINGVSKKFKDKWALHPLSLQVQAGECIALIGGNGAGKSTLLHIIAGISAPFEGKVTLENETCTKNRKRYVSMIGYMPDEFHAQNSLTVMEFLTFYGRLRNVTDIRIREVIEFIGLEDKKYEEVRNLSKGMRQRLLFGQAYIAKPKLLILDEPTNGLDPIWINTFIKRLNKIKREGTSIIFSTHMMDVAAEVADRILFMEKGKLIKDIVNPHEQTTEFMMVLLRLYRDRESS